MQYIALAQTLLFAIWWTIRFKKDGVPNSLSADFYRLREQGKQHYFDRFFFAMALPMWAYGYYDYKDSTQILLALAGFFLACVPIASFFRDKFTAVFHYIGASGAIGFGFWGLTNELWGESLWSKVVACIPLAAFIAVCIVLRVRKVKNLTTWVEVAAAGLWPILIFVK